MKHCRICEVPLVAGGNWTAAKRKARAYICNKCDSAAGSAYKRANRDKINESVRKYRNANKDKRRAWNQAYKKANPEKVKACEKAYAKANRGKRNAIGAKYRAMKKDQTPDMNKAELVEIEAMYEYHQIFNAVMPEKKWHVDHIEALANGGLHHPSNLQVLTEAENLAKSDSKNWTNW